MKNTKMKKGFIDPLSIVTIMGFMLVSFSMTNAIIQESQQSQKVNTEKVLESTKDSSQLTQTKEV